MHIPNPSGQIASSNGMVILPPAASASKMARACATVSYESVSVMPSRVARHQHLAVKGEVGVHDAI